MANQVEDELGLAALWRREAERASDATLATLAALLPVGLVVAALMAAWRPGWLAWWPLLIPVMLLGAFGAWGVANRELKDDVRPLSGYGALIVLWRAVRGVAVMIAIGSAALAMGEFVRAALGVVIS
jgi:hypothetical protein